ncbi:jg15001 [Pararge aegeria aegeria]|uniref:Jg15001 protein n=1 Tax=Pararge aegeria aegeria TaxID=348720 RepID=A0A8S4QI75_9NEOP|nr:jg15001 [Pararge aegeria aegeria]
MARSCNHATDYKKDIKNTNPRAQRSYRFGKIVGESDHAGRQSLDNKRGVRGDARVADAASCRASASVRIVKALIHG